MDKQIKQLKKSQNTYLKALEEQDLVPKIILEQLQRLELELETLAEKRNRILAELDKPTIQEVSLDEVYTILSHLSNLLPIVAPDKQKHLLHSVISKITVNEGDSPPNRSIKDIELVFNVSKEVNHVFTYGKVHRA